MPGRSWDLHLSPLKKAMPETTPVTPRFDAAALELLHARYLGKDLEGRVLETPEDMFRRVARHVAAVEERYGGDAGEWANRFEHAMSALEFLPNSPTLMNAGTPVGQLAACFVLPVDDHLESIFATMRDAALIHRSGGGVGFDFSRLRPAGDPLASTGGVSSGPVSFMRVFDAASEAVRSGGRRRAANMGVMDVHHPDIEAFIAAKRDSPGLRTFNLSVACDDAFMKAMTQRGDIPLANPRTGSTVAVRSAARLFDVIVECAWATGDPGLLFLDRINQDNPTPALGRITATNPCGEVPLLPNEACFLGSINLARLTRGNQLDWARLGELVDLAVRFLDGCIDASRFPIPAIARAVVATRKIGVGIMGFADCLVDLGIAYDSERALEAATEIMTVVDERATQASRHLAHERGPFPAFAESRDAAAHRPAIRNATRTAIAPTGSLALLAGCSHSIEPYYALAYSRRMLDERTWRVLNPRLVREAQALGVWNPALRQHALATGTVRDEPSLPARLRTLFPTALDIDLEWHVRMQAAFQQRVDNGVSKTINLPESAPQDTIRNAFRLAWTLGCKGITVYRQGARAGQVLGPAEADVAQCPECTSGPATPISQA
jgi:ribonucleoside-diphosphate reductase alpha chain